MARTRSANPLVKPVIDPVRSYIEGVAKNLVERIYGSDGPAWGTKLTAIEDVCLAIRETLSEKMLDEALSRQAATVNNRPTPFRCCPKCGKEVEPDEPEPRILQTQARHSAPLVESIRDR